MSLQQIPQRVLDDLIARTDIVELIDQRLPLRSAGNNFKALCPFHQEKSPSFTVSQTKQFYYCFGCQASGNAIGFLMAYDRLSFIEAVEYLARQQGVTLPKEYIGESVHNKASPDYYELLKQVMRFYSATLKANDRAIQYLKNRGLTGEVCKRFGIGYAKAEWDALIKHFGATSVPTLLETGMLIEKNNSRYDRFRDRIMFPVRDKSGRILGFGGRIIDNGEPKYLNSPETLLFHKGSELYGLYEAMQAQRHFDYILVVEGYMDVIALAQYGISAVVATMGTALTQKQMNRLFRTSQEVILCFDGDTAGRQAAWRALEVSLPLLGDERSLKFIFLPEDEDPDTCVRKMGAEAMLKRIKEASPFSEVFIKHLLAQVDTSHVSGQARLMSLAAPLLAQLPQGVLCEMLIEQLGAYTRLDKKRLLQMVFPDQKSTPQKVVAKSGMMGLSAVDKALCLLLQHTKLADLLERVDDLATLPQPQIHLLIELVQLLQLQPGLSTGAILAHWTDPKIQSELAALAARPLLLAEEAAVTHEFVDIIEKLRKEVTSVQLGDLLVRIRQNDLSTLSPTDQARVHELLRKDEE